VLADVGGTASSWQVLLLVRSGQWDTQTELAEAMGITGATLTHHLAALERDGLVRRWRDDGNRRVQHAALTADGEALFERLREVAIRHDERLRAHLTAAETKLLGELLGRLEAAVAEPD
jgi:MarR family transcriptional regulator for hemolysin